MSGISIVMLFEICLMCGLLIGLVLWWGNAEVPLIVFTAIWATLIKFYNSTSQNWMESMQYIYLFVIIVNHQLDVLV